MAVCVPVCELLIRTLLAALRCSAGACRQMQGAAYQMMQSLTALVTCFQVLDLGTPAGDTSAREQGLRRGVARARDVLALTLDALAMGAGHVLALGGAVPLMVKTFSKLEVSLVCARHR